MHRCESFRESLAEHLVGPSAASAVDLSPAVREELENCAECARFWEEARAGMARFSAALELRGDSGEWDPAGFADRLRRRIINDRVVGAPPTPRPAGWSWLWSPLAPAIALVLVILVAFEAVDPTSSGGGMPDLSGRQLVTDRVLDIDPLTVDFLERSELFLRSFMKIGPADVEDLEESQEESVLQLPDLEQRREALLEFPPVLMVIDDYEEVLRDIRNLSTEVNEEDLADIQDRIRRNGLVGRMKVYQPASTLVEIVR